MTETLNRRLRSNPRPCGVGVALALLATILSVAATAQRDGDGASLTAEPTAVALTAGGGTAPVRVTLTLPAPNTTGGPATVSIAVEAPPRPCRFAVDPGRFEISVPPRQASGSATIALSAQVDHPEANCRLTLRSVPTRILPDLPELTAFAAVTVKAATVPAGRLTLEPVALEVEPGATAGPVTATVVLDRPASSALTLAVTPALPAPLRGQVTTDPARLAVRIARGETRGSARFRVVTRDGAPPGQYRIPLTAPGPPNLEAVMTLVLHPPNPCRLEVRPDPIVVVAGERSAAITLAVVDAPRAGITVAARPRLPAPLRSSLTVEPPSPTIRVPAGQGTASTTLRLKAAREAPAGRHTLTFEDPEGRCEPARLTLEISAPPPPPQSGGRLTLEPAALRVAPGETSSPVTATVLLDGSAPSPLSLELALEAPPALRGTVRSQPARPVVSIPRGERRGSVQLRLVVDAGAPGGTHGLSWTAPGPPDVQATLALTVVPPSPCRLEVRPDRIAVVADERSDPITLAVADAPRAGITVTARPRLPAPLRSSLTVEPPSLTIRVPAGHGTARATLHLRADREAPAGRHELAFEDPEGRCEPADLTVEIAAPAPTGELALRLVPGDLQLCAGGAATTVTAHVEPVGGYRGRPELSWTQVPAGLSVEPRRLAGPTLPPAGTASFRIAARPNARGRHALSLRASDVARKLETTASIHADVAAPEFTPHVEPAQLALVSDGPPQNLTFGVEANRCLAGAEVRVELFGLPAGLSASAAAGLRGPGFEPATVSMTPALALAPGRHHLTAVFTTPGLPPKSLEVPLVVAAVPPPRIERIQPDQVAPGRRYTLELEGRGLSADLEVSFGHEIELLDPPNVAASDRAVVDILVSPGARPGPRTAHAANRFGSTDGPGTLIVSPLAPNEIPPVLVPRVVGVVPAEVAPGTELIVVLHGENLTADTEVSFGQGIEILNQTRIRSATRGEVDILVLPQASAGERLVTVTAASGASRGPARLRVSAASEPSPGSPGSQIGIGPLGFETPLGLSLYKVRPAFVPCKTIDVGWCPEDQLQLEATVIRPPPGAPQAAKQTLRWSTQLQGLTGLEWQVFYFKPSNAPDLAPPHVVDKSPVVPWGNPSGGDFLIDLGPYLLPKLKLPKKQNKSVSQSTQSPETVAFDSALTTGSEPSKTSPVTDAGPITIDPKDTVIDGGSSKSDPTSKFLPGVPAQHLPNELWVRVVGKLGSTAVTASNPVRFVVVESQEPVTVDGSNLAQPMPAGAYLVRILSYHGLTPPLNQKPCFSTTQDAWLTPTPVPGYSTDPKQGVGGKIPAGTPICQPKPKTESGCSWSTPGACVAKVVDLLASGVNLLSKAWSDLKDLAVKIAMEATQLSWLCDEVGQTSACEFAVRTALDVGLIALGVPPDIPNFDQLLEEGIEYVAIQAASQIAIPPEVIQQATEAGGPFAGMALEYAEAELRKQAQQEIETALVSQLQKAQYAYASQVDWLKKYQGLPMKPDPRNGVQPPTLRVQITRNPKVEIPKSPKIACTLDVDVQVTNDFTHPGVVIPKAAQPHLKPGYPYRLYESQSRSLPALKPGDQVVVPILLEPYMGYQGVPNVQMYWSKNELWYALMRGGTAKITAGSVYGGCPSGDQLTVAADTWAPDPT